MDKDLILFVEDIDSILFNLILLLELNEYTVLSAKDGKQALEVLTNSLKRPNIIISDIIMPNMDGYEFLQKVSENTNWNMIPFIFLSAKASPDDIKLGKYLGADDYLTKPIDEELLLKLIKNKIHKSRNLELELEKSINSKVLTKMKNFFVINKNSRPNERIYLFIVESENLNEPRITEKLTGKTEIDSTLDSVIIELFKDSTSLFNSKKLAFPESMTFKITALDLTALFLFEKVELSSIQKILMIMIGILASSISYYDIIRLKNTVQSLFSEIKNEETLDILFYYEQIQSILVQT